MRSGILITSLIANVALATIVAVQFRKSPAEPATLFPPHPTSSSVAQNPTATPTIVTSAPVIPTLAPAALSSETPAPAPVSPPNFIPAPGAPIASLPRPTPQRERRDVTAAVAPAGLSNPISQPAPDLTLGPANPVNPSLPGNFFVSRGIRVAVAETYPAAQGGGDMPLGIDLTPVDPPVAEDTSAAIVSSPSTATDGGKPTPRQQNSSASQPPASPAVGSRSSTSGKGVSPASDEDFFRMKYGWAAFDAAQTEAMIEAANRGQ